MATRWHHKKIHNSGYYAHAQVLNAYSFCLSLNSINLIRMFIGQFLKGNNMVQLRLHNGRYYAHAQVLNAYNFCFS